ncbi:hypothetical protein AAZX31_17G123700 [Glycine max]|uniref:HTH OST-type domain-containing protein n=1 Tax=Glycine max TaxID=3847 RepID=K7MLE0_SOYBN|nr:uncharacterized protein LOC102661134 [Glycine max]KAG4930285.1 hypothetical protein JHK86_047246 [Glycine max]KAG4943178.1 hypothetical protein JHK85_047824 [Glycine max]KAG5097498.1 hypothetical protein JHK82_047352 [Glycine max]KAG5102287.1 hypothetical protein JHK84_047256 [Glycine max]KAH1118214.1 hypothetical protein GYH30_047112 [Glycine max]|eukprot:XP_006600798.1 uncharacterized protein LOC102661134 [Glycine max]
MATGYRLFLIPAARPLLRKNFFFISSYSTRALQPCQPSSSAEEKSRDVRVWAWWDFTKCHVPHNFDVLKVAPTIMEAMRANGIRGPLNITAFGDVLLLSRVHQEALAYTGVRFIHVKDGRSSTTDILVDLMYWVSQNPPPAHILLISGDRDFAGVLHRLRTSNYNILLATPESAPGVLHSAATIAWHWSSMLKEGNLTGKCFNHPPDGPYGSWYGSYKPDSLEKPAPVAAQEAADASLPNVEVHEPSSLGSVPKSVVKQVRRILSLHPKGIDIDVLRAELVKCGERLDKGMFGHKRFSRFLLSLPRVQLRPGVEGFLAVHLVPSESPEPCESSSVASTMSGAKNKEKGCAATPKVNGEDKSKVKGADEKFSIAPIRERSSDDKSKPVQPSPSQGRSNEEYVDGESSSPVLVEKHVCQPPNKLQKSSVACDKVVDVANAQHSETQLPPKDNKDSETKMDSLKVTCQKSSVEDIVRCEDAGHKSMEKHTTSENHSAGNDQSMVEDNVIANYESGDFEAKNKCEDPTRMEVDEVVHSPSSSPVDGSPVVQTPGASPKTNNRTPTFFSWIRSWWPFGRSNEKYDDLIALQNKAVSHVEGSKLSELDQTVSQSEEPKLSELDQDVSHAEDSKLSELDQTVSQFEEPKLTVLDQTVSHSAKPELFSSASFWNNMESFIFAPKGSLLFSQSRSREDVVHKLQNGGPLVLRSLPKEDILQLVELLITEKKWLEENPSKTFPFKLIRPVQKKSSVNQSHDVNGLRSLFIGRTSQSNLQKSLEHDVEKHNQSIAHSQVSAPTMETKYTERSRNDILEDCKKLVSEMLREHPEGYNIGSFQRLFVDRYGYHLDIQKLGYQKLAALLQIMPGVKLESTYIFPSVPAVCDSDLETSILKTQATTDIHAASNSDSESSESAPKDDNMESLWCEVGPVSINNSDKSGLELKPSQKTIELDTSKSKHPDYEPVVSDDEFSASEGDDSCLTQSAQQRKPKCNEQDSSFWQAMDLWHSSKEEENSGKKSNNVDSLDISLAEILDSSTESTRDTLSQIPSSKYRENNGKKSDNVDSLDTSLADMFNSSSTESTTGTLSKIPSSNYREKQRSHKNYSFVADPVLPNKEKLVDDLKKADESKMQN